MAYKYYYKEEISDNMHKIMDHLSDTLCLFYDRDLKRFLKDRRFSKEVKTINNMLEELNDIQKLIPKK